MCYKKLLIEGDANIVIESILGTQRLPLKIVNVIRDCKILCYDYNLEINISYIFIGKLIKQQIIRLQ